MAGDERAVRLTAGGCGKLWQLNNLRVRNSCCCCLVINVVVIWD